ncbi:MAG: GntR family transcriptional regulator [Thermoleophilia bacterium]|nr:GntR family transcriptional regulator [Thermoleophilia bacterium]
MGGSALPESANGSTPQQGGGSVAQPTVSARVAQAGYRGRTSHEPAYLHIANAIADRIGAGVYRPGDQLPTEALLRAEFGVSPMTVRRAISILLDRGLVTTTQGKGTFVRALDLGEAVFRLQEITDMWIGDDSVDVVLLEASIAGATEEVATMLECAPGAPTVFMRRLIRRRGVPLIYQLEHVLYDEHRPLVESQLQVMSLDGLLRSSRGAGIPSGQLTIEAVNLEADEASMLGVPDGSPAFRLAHIFSDFDGQRVSGGVFLCRGDQFRLTTHIGVLPVIE